MTKVCTQCKTEKELTDYAKKTAASDGRKSACKQCINLDRNLNKDSINKKRRKDYQLNPHSYKQRCRTYYRNNTEKEQHRKSAWYQKNRERVLTSQALYAKGNRGKRNSINRKYQATKMQAIPSWLSQNDKKWINWIYEQAQRLQEYTGVNQHVDHIHPLQGKDICGLHVPWNLQILTAQENQQKSNKLVDIAGPRDIQLSLERNPGIWRK